MVSSSEDTSHSSWGAIVYPCVRVKEDVHDQRDSALFQGEGLAVVFCLDSVRCE